MPDKREIDALIARLAERRGGILGESLCDDAIAALRAAQEIPREPTEAMTAAGVAAIPFFCSSPQNDVISTWQAMYDAAIASKRSEP